MSWEGTDGQFVIIRPDHVAQLWGERNGRRNMTYQKFSRALRYYYHKKVLTKIRGQKYTYKFNLQELERQYGYTDIWLFATSESRGNGGRMISPSGARICDVLPASSHVMKFASHEIPDTPFEPFVYSHCFPFFFDFNQDWTHSADAQTRTLGRSLSDHNVSTFSFFFFKRTNDISEFDFSEFLRV